MSQYQAVKNIYPGCLLISEPFLPDPNFERSVVLICEHNAKGSFGLVLNRSTGIVLTDLLDDNLLPPAPVYIGGPVEPQTLHYLTIAENPPLNSRNLMNGIHWGGDFDDLRHKLISRQIDINQVRFFVGYSGWGEEQLQAEVDANSWLISMSSDFSILISDPDMAQWTEVLKKMGGKYRSMANYPPHPSYN